MKGTVKALKNRVLSAILACFIMIMPLAGIPASAADREFTLRVSSATAVPGDSIVLNVDIENNPGIMAVTVTFHFDPEVLQYEKYYGGILVKDTIATHNGYISIVYCRSNDIAKNGTLFGIGFKVKDSAQVGKYPVTVKNNRCEDTLNGAFANWNSERLTGTVIPGTVEIGYNGSNCSHRYGGYTETVPSGCNTVGIRSRSCTVCGHTETEQTPKLGHKYDENWTVDKAAAEQESGVMSRHCLRCDSVTDKVTFTLNDAAGNGFANEVGTVLAPGSWEPLKIVETPDSSRDNTAPEPEPETPEETPDADILPEKPDNSSEEPVSAEELVNNVKRAQKTGLARWFSYVLGDSESAGILSIIRASVPKKLAISSAGIIISLVAAIFGILL